MAPPFILTLLLAAKVEHQEEDTPKLWAALSSEVGRQKTRPNRDSRYGLASWLTLLVTFTDCPRAACNRSYGEQGCSRELQSPLLIGAGQLGVFVCLDRTYGARRGDQIDCWVNVDDVLGRWEASLEGSW